MCNTCRHQWDDLFHEFDELKHENKALRAAVQRAENFCGAVYDRVSCERPRAHNGKHAWGSAAENLLIEWDEHGVREVTWSSEDWDR